MLEAGEQVRIECKGLEHVRRLEKFLGAFTKKPVRPGSIEIAIRSDWNFGYLGTSFSGFNIEDANVFWPQRGPAIKFSRSGFPNSSEQS